MPRSSSSFSPIESKLSTISTSAVSNSSNSSFSVSSSIAAAMPRGVEFSFRKSIFLLARFTHHGRRDASPAGSNTALAEASRQAVVAAQEAALAASAAETAGNHAVALVAALRESEARLSETRRRVAGPRAVVLALLRALPAARRDPNAHAVGNSSEGSRAGDAALASLRQLLHRMDSDLDPDTERDPSVGEINMETRRQPALEDVLCDALDALSRCISEPAGSDPHPPEVELSENARVQPASISVPVCSELASASVQAEPGSPQRALTRRRSPASGPSRPTGAATSPCHAALTCPTYVPRYLSPVPHSLSPSSEGSVCNAQRGTSPAFASPGAARGAAPAAPRNASPSHPRAASASNDSPIRSPIRSPTGPPIRCHSYLSAARQEAHRQREHTHALEASVARLTAESTALRVSLQTLCLALRGAEDAFAALRLDAASSVALRAAVERAESKRDEEMQELDIRSAIIIKLRATVAELRQLLSAAEVERERVRAEAVQLRRAMCRAKEASEAVLALEGEIAELRRTLWKTEHEREVARAQAEEHARRLDHCTVAIEEGRRLGHWAGASEDDGDAPELSSAQGYLRTLEQRTGVVEDEGRAPVLPGHAEAARLTEDRDRHRTLVEAEMCVEHLRRREQQTGVVEAMQNGVRTPVVPGAARLTEERDRHRRLAEAEMRAELSRQLSQAKAEVERLTTEHESVTRQLAQSQADVGRRTAEHQTVTRQLAQQRVQLANLSRDLAAARAAPGDCANGEQRPTRTAAIAPGAWRADSEVSSALAGEQSRHAEALSELQQLRDRHAEATSELRELRAGHAETFSELRGLREGHAEALAELEGLRDLQADTAATRSRNLREFRGLNGQHAETVSELRGLRERPAAASAELEALRDLYAEALRELKELRERHAVASSELRELCDRYDESLTELRELRDRHADTEATRDVLAAQLAASQRCERAARREQLKARGAAERMQRLVGVVWEAYAAMLAQPQLYFAQAETHLAQPELHLSQAEPHPASPRRSRAGAEGLTSAGRAVQASAGAQAGERLGGSTDGMPGGTADGWSVDTRSMLQLIDVEMALVVASLTDSGEAGGQVLQAGRGGAEPQPVALAVASSTDTGGAVYNGGVGGQVLQAGRGANGWAQALERTRAQPDDIV